MMFMCIYVHIHIYKTYKHIHNILYVCVYRKNLHRNLKNITSGSLGHGQILIFSFRPLCVFICECVIFTIKLLFKRQACLILFSLILFATVYGPNRAEFTLLSFFPCSLVLAGHCQLWVLELRTLGGFGGRYGSRGFICSSLPYFVVSKEDTEIKLICARIGNELSEKSEFLMF